MSEPEVIVVSNRVPDPGNTHAGGLTVALEGLKRGIWLGPNDKVNPETGRAWHREDTPVGSSLTYVKFACSKELYEKNYLLCSEEIWMSFHGIKANYPERIADDKIQAYWSMAQAIAKNIKSYMAKCAEPDKVIVNVQDFHNMSVAKALREDGGIRNPLGFFLHIPFPSPHDLEGLPKPARGQVETLVLGLLDYDQIGFQTPADAENFMTFAKDHGAVPFEENRLAFNNRRIAIGVFPVGIDPDYAVTSHAQPSSDPDIHNILADPRKMVLGVDRIDPAKNLPHKIRAYGEFLQRNKGAENDVCFVQVAPMSREASHYYRDERTTVQMEVDAINSLYGRPDRPAIRLLNKTISHADVYNLHAHADVFAIFSRDGAMLGAYEFPAAKEGYSKLDPKIIPGTLIISEGAGAHTIVGDEAIVVKHDDMDGFATAIEEALTMPVDIQRRNQDAMMVKIRANNDEVWLRSFLAATQDAAGRRWEPLLLGDSLRPILDEVRDLLPPSPSVQQQACPKLN